MNLSIAALIVSFIAGGVGVFSLLAALAGPTSVDAADIEAWGPYFRRSRRSGPTYLVRGRLRDSQRVTIGAGDAAWIYAPLVSAGRDGDEPARVYFCARAADYVRARDEGRFVGYLHADRDARVRERFAAAGHPLAGSPMRLTFHDTRQADFDASEVFLGVALLLGVLAIVGIWRAQRQTAAE